MELFVVILIAAIVIGICFLVDKAFISVFRSKPQHMSGLSVRVNKRYAAFGAVFTAVGIAGLISLGSNKLLLFASLFVIILGICLVIFYMTFGIFYDEESFIITTFGRSSKTYRFDAIVCQQLYLTSSHVIIELTLNDKRTISLQSSMEGIYPFMDTAFAGWCRQKGKYVEDCPFYDPSNSCWFPSVEEI